MSSSLDFIQFVCEQIAGTGIITYRKMFGEYMVYVNGKPLLLVCDNTVYIKMLACLEQEMQNAETGFPYPGAKPHYILDVENQEFSQRIIGLLGAATPPPAPKRSRPPRSSSPSST